MEGTLLVLVVVTTDFMGSEAYRLLSNCAPSVHVIATDRYLTKKPSLSLLSSSLQPPLLPLQKERTKKNIKP